MSRMANRQLAVLRILENGRKVTIKELCEKTESSRSTILRDLLDLSADYPIETKAGRYGGLVMNKAAKTGNQYLTKAELLYITQAICAYSTKNDELKDTILQKLLPP